MASSVEVLAGDTLRAQAAELERWRDHAEADCAALRRVWRGLAELDRIAAELDRQRPNGATSRVVADTLTAATREVRAAVLGERGAWTVGGDTP